MESVKKNVPLGITQQHHESGLHICQVFGDDKERLDAMLTFLFDGLQLGERVCCFSEKSCEQEVRILLENRGISFSEAKASEQLTLAETQETYFEGGCFDPDRMLRLLRKFYADSMDSGYSGARVLGEMNSVVQKTPGGSRLLEYESKVSVLIRTHPITAVCQYDARAFDGATILDVLKVHPLMIVGGATIRNPFFTPPDEFLTG